MMDGPRLVKPCDSFILVVPATSNPMAMASKAQAWLMVGVKDCKKLTMRCDEKRFVAAYQPRQTFAKDKPR